MIAVKPNCGCFVTFDSYAIVFLQGGLGTKIPLTVSAINKGKDGTA